MKFLITSAQDSHKTRTRLAQTRTNTHKHAHTRTNTRTDPQSQTPTDLRAATNRVSVVVDNLEETLAAHVGDAVVLNLGLQRRAIFEVHRHAGLAQQVEDVPKVCSVAIDKNITLVVGLQFVSATEHGPEHRLVAVRRQRRERRLVPDASNVEFDTPFEFFEGPLDRNIGLCKLGLGRLERLGVGEQLLLDALARLHHFLIPTFDGHHRVLEERQVGEGRDRSGGAVGGGGEGEGIRHGVCNCV